MRIGPVRIERDRAHAAAEPTGKPDREVGASGTVNVSGFLQPDEYSSDLAFPQSITVYDRMRRSDASVREAYMHIFAPLLNATAGVEPAGDDPLDLEVAEFGRRAFFEWPVDPWTQRLRQTLNYLLFGFQIFELPEQIVEEEISYVDPKTGDTVTVPSRQFVAWRRWAYRKPRTIYKWNVADGELVSVEQQVLKGNDYANPVIPADQLVIFVNEKEGDDFTGVSLLRSAHKAWWLKELLEKTMGVAFERHGRGVDVAYLPEDSKNDQAMIDRVSAMLKGLRAGEFHHMVFPGPKGTVSGQGGNGGFLYEIVSPGQFPDFSSSLEYLRGEIKGDFLARFAELGHGSTGARATAGVQSEVWYAAIHAVAHYIEDVSSQALRRLIDKNYQVTRYPKLVLRDIETRSLEQFADFVAKTGAVGGLVFDQSARSAIRKVGDLPDEDEPGDQPPPVEEDPAAPPPAPKKQQKPETDPAQLDLNAPSQ